MNKVLLSHKSDEWSTPRWLFDYLDGIFHFTLDPCATLENHLCQKFYTIDDDGLSKDWTGDVVFCNPPYSKVKHWVKKASESDCISVLLVPARTDTIWFHQFCLRSNCVINFIRGRLKFSSSPNPAPFPSMILIFNYHEC